jgi:hypothetical protein
MDYISENKLPDTNILCTSNNCNFYFNFLEYEILNHIFTISFYTSKKIRDILEFYNYYNYSISDDFKIINHNLKNIWNKFIYITISILDKETGKSYSYTIPGPILEEINDNMRLVINYPCECFNSYPNFNWLTLFELILNKFLPL